MSKQNNMARRFCSNIKFKSLIVCQLHCTVFMFDQTFTNQHYFAVVTTRESISWMKVVFLRHNVPSKFNSRKTCCEKEGWNTSGCFPISITLLFTCTSHPMSMPHILVDGEYHDLVISLIATRMYSSRMRTVRSSGRISGGVPGPGGCTWSQGVYMVPGGCT